MRVRLPFDGDFVAGPRVHDGVECGAIGHGLDNGHRRHELGLRDIDRSIGGHRCLDDPVVVGRHGVVDGGRGQVHLFHSTTGLRLNRSVAAAATVAVYQTALITQRRYQTPTARGLNLLQMLILQRLLLWWLQQEIR